MENQGYRNTLAFLLVILVLSVMLLLSGCMTTYSVERQMADGSYVKVLTKSFRKFEQPSLEYETPDGVIFRFNAESANTDYSPVEAAIADMIRTGALVTNPIPIGER